MPVSGSVLLRLFRKFAFLLLAPICAAAWSGEARARPQPSPHYSGNDLSRIPADARRFVVTEGLTINGISFRSDSDSAELTYHLTSKVYKGYRGQRGEDAIHVSIYWHSDQKNADSGFKDRVTNLGCAGSKFANHHCERVSLAANVVGTVDIWKPEGYPQYEVKQTDQYIVEPPGSENAVIDVEGVIYSNWSTDETLVKSIASQFAGLGPTRILDQTQGTGQAATAPTPQVVAAPMPPQTVAMSKLSAAVNAAWSALPTREDAEKSIIGKPAFIVERDDLSDVLMCSDNDGVKQRFPDHGKKVPARLLENRTLLAEALRSLNISESEVAALLDGVTISGSAIAAAIRERSYLLGEPNYIRDFLYNAQFNIDFRPAGGLQKTDWRVGAPLLHQILFAGGSSCMMLGSSEHSSIYGTINGGGDFIDYVAPQSDEPRLIPIATSPAPQIMMIALPGAAVTIRAGTMAAIDLAPNGIAAVAVLSGSAEVSEQSTGAHRTVAPGQLAVSAPGIGVSQPIAITQSARQNLEEGQRGPAGAQATPQTKAQPIPQTAAPHATAQLSDIQTARRVAFGRPVGATDTFEPGTEPIYVWFHYAGIPTGSRITAVWYFLETTKPLEIGRGDVTVTPPSDWGQFSYALGEGKAWPEGRYRIDLLVNDQMAASTNFRVAGHATPTGSNAPPSASGPQTYADATLGYRLKMPAEWVRDETTTDRLLLVNAAEGIKLDIILASDAAPQSDSTVFHTQENLNRNNPDIEMLAGYSRFFPAVSRVGYCMEMHMRPKDLIEFLVILPRGRSGTNTDYYAMKVYGPPARKDAIEHAVDQFIAGFEIDNQ